MSSLWKFGVVALIALLLVVLPGGGSALNLVLTLLSIAFFAAIALFGYRLYRENSFTLDGFDPRQKLILYGSVGGAFLVFTATPFLFAGVGILIWLALLGLCSYGVYYVVVRSRRVE